MTNGNDITHSFAGTEYSQMSIEGLTKREYFAAMAMQGILSDPNVVMIEDAAELGVKAADALIAALNKTQTEVK